VEKRRAGALLSRRARRDTPTRPIAWISHLSLIDRFIRLDYLLITICIDPDGLCTSDQAMRRTELSRLESPAHAVTPMAGTHTHDGSEGENIGHGHVLGQQDISGRSIAGDLSSIARRRDIFLLSRLPS
jgi:hypothetical protein